ncbi:MAG: hypothetical protein AAF571_13260 [Verrucomicrobiota bacterium]
MPFGLDLFSSDASTRNELTNKSQGVDVSGADSIALSGIDSDFGDVVRKDSRQSSLFGGLQLSNTGESLDLRYSDLSSIFAPNEVNLSFGDKAISSLFDFKQAKATAGNAVTTLTDKIKADPAFFAAALVVGLAVLWRMFK